MKSSEHTFRTLLRRQRLVSALWLFAPLPVVATAFVLTASGSLGERLAASWKPIVEISIFVLLFQLLFRYLRGTRGEGILKGITAVLLLGFMALFYLADAYELPRLRVVVENMFQYAVIALVIIFQPELRRGLVRIGEKPLVRLFLRDTVSVVDPIVEACTRMAKNRVGALIAIEREVGLGTYIEGGVRTDAEISAPLLETIFFPGTALHDGACIVRENRLAAAGCFFPLTDDPGISKQLGSRHRAGIGVTEETDAVVVIVSEETGQISIAV
ncbi:MAG: TIGR00159 family protein, partial [Planctomycetota bacterium]